MKAYTSKRDEIYKKLEEKITSGEYPAEYKFPSELVLSKELGIGRITLRAALEKLEGKGFVVRIPGKGTFVASEKTIHGKPKKFLVLVNVDLGKMEAPSTYLTPSIERNCEKRGIETEIVPLDLIRALSDNNDISMLRKANYDGVILNSSFYHGDEKEIRILKALDKPVIIPHAKENDYEATGFGIMYTDQKKSWSESIRFLIELGHSTIITLASESERSGRNLRGFDEKEYLDFLAKEGANPDPELLTFIPLNFKGLTKLLSEMLKSNPSPTAIMCFSDFYAINVYESLASLSLKVPDDISVMGYCGFPGAHMLSPPLSTVDFDYASIGAKAVEILERAGEWYNKDNVPPKVASKYKLIVRSSTNMVVSKNAKNRNYA